MKQKEKEKHLYGFMKNLITCSCMYIHMYVKLQYPKRDSLQGSIVIVYNV